MNDADTLAIPIIEERATIDTREVVSGQVRVRTVVDTSDELVSATLDRETLRVERRPVDRAVDVAPAPRDEGDATVISIVEERLVVTKALFVVEEVVIHRATTTEQVEVPVSLRSTRAIVEQQSPNEQEIS